MKMLSFYGQLAQGPPCLSLPIWLKIKCKETGIPLKPLTRAQPSLEPRSPGRWPGGRATRMLCTPFCLPAYHRLPRKREGGYAAPPRWGPDSRLSAPCYPGSRAGRVSQSLAFVLRDGCCPQACMTGSHQVHHIQVGCLQQEVERHPGQNQGQATCPATVEQGTAGSQHTPGSRLLERASLELPRTKGCFQSSPSAALAERKPEKQKARDGRW